MATLVNRYVRMQGTTARVNTRKSIATRSTIAHPSAKTRTHGMPELSIGRFRTDQHTKIHKTSYTKIR